MRKLVVDLLLHSQGSPKGKKKYSNNRLVVIGGRGAVVRIKHMHDVNLRIVKKNSPQFLLLSNYSQCGYAIA